MRMMASLGARILGLSRSSTRTSPGAYRTVERMILSFLGSVVAGSFLCSVDLLDSELERVATVGDRLQPGVDGADRDKAGTGDGTLTVDGVDDGQGPARRPVAQLPHLVGEHRLATLVERPRHGSRPLQSEQVVHGQRQRQQRGKVAGGG